MHTHRFLDFATIRLADGVRRRHLAAYFVAVFFTSIFMGVINMAQPWVLSNLLEIPREAQGRATSALLFANEVVLIGLLGTFGLLSDRMGRKVVYVLGFLFAAFGAWLFPRATDLPTLIAFRAVGAVGSAALTAMMVAVVADYPREDSRGRANGWQGVIAGLGAFFMFFVIMKVPSRLAASGTSDVRAIGETWFSIIALCGIAGALVALGLRGKTGGRARTEAKKPLGVMAKEALQAAREDRALALAYGAAFVSRGDLAVQGTFVALWINQAGTARGLGPDGVAAMTGAIGGIAPLFAVGFAPIAGLLSDRTTRVRAVLAMALLSAAAYLGMVFVDDPLGRGMMAMMGLMGMAEIGAFVASQALVSERAPAHLRGSVTGFFGVSGALGIMLGTVSGGFLFDRFGPSAPFVTFGVLNVALSLWASRLAGARQSAPLPGVPAT